MALAVSSVSGVGSRGPTTSLQQALSAFEACLTDEQRRQLHSQPVTSSTENVVAFAQQIDADNLSARRCVAPRLITLLEATKQFSDIVDTFVSSNPSIAGLVWGSLKTTILIANNACSYFEKVTALIMKIGRSCPVYEQFTGLYPDSEHLQRSLSDYFAIIIRICIKIVEVSHRSTLKHTFSSIISPFESDFSPLCNDLDEAKKDIQLQISLAAKRVEAETKKILERESKRASSYISTSTKFFRRTEEDNADAREWRVRKTQRDTEKLRSRIRANLSTIDYVSSWKQAMRQRVPGTAEWLQQESIFDSWLADPASSILWCAGTMGIGKTVLMSSVLFQLQASRKSQDTIAYFFCRADDEKTIESRHILGTVLRQLLETPIATADETTLWAMRRDSNGFDPADAARWVTIFLEDKRDYFIIIDGLDECQDKDLEYVADFLAAMLQKFPSGCKILCTGRPELERRLFKSVSPTQRFQISREKVRPDMDRYITAVLDDCLKGGRLQLGDPALQLKIAEVLRERADGM